MAAWKGFQNEKMTWLDSTVQIIKCFVSLPDGEP